MSPGSNQSTVMATTSRSSGFLTLIANSTARSAAERPSALFERSFASWRARSMTLGARRIQAMKSAMGSSQRSASRVAVSADWPRCSPARIEATQRYVALR